MLRYLVIVGLASLLFVGSAHAAKAAPSGTIALAEVAPYQIGETVHFAWTASGLKGNQTPRIELNCRLNGEVVYGEAQPTAGNAFLLGGGGSLWLYEHSHESVDCEAFLYYWDNHPVQHQVILSSPVSFSAGGLP